MLKQIKSQEERLTAKTQDQRMINEIVAGTGISPWEAEIAIKIIHEVYFAEPGNGPLRSGQMRYECISSTQGAGKSIKESRMTAVVLTLIEPEDHTVRAQKGSDGLRCHKLLRLTEEAREQGGLLSQEDLAQILDCDTRTVIRRNIASLRNDYDIYVPTRGQQKDIGPGVTHRGQAVKHWLEGKEPQEVALAINHSLTSVERYLQHFSRVVFLGGKGFEKLQIAFTIGISNASVGTYLELYHLHKDTVGFRNRLGELKAIGASHYDGSDEKKG